MTWHILDMHGYRWGAPSLMQALELANALRRKGIRCAVFASGGLDPVLAPLNWLVAK